MDVVMSLLDRNGLGDWLADRLVEISDTVKTLRQFISMLRESFG
jgi:hypothetical protein